MEDTKKFTFLLVLTITKHIIRSISILWSFKCILFSLVLLYIEHRPHVLRRWGTTTVVCKDSKLTQMPKISCPKKSQQKTLPGTKPNIWVITFSCFIACLPELSFLFQTFTCSRIVEIRSQYYPHLHSSKKACLSSVQQWSEVDPQALRTPRIDSRWMEFRYNSVHLSVKYLSRTCVYDSPIPQQSFVYWPQQIGKFHFAF